MKKIALLLCLSLVLSIGSVALAKEIIKMGEDIIVEMGVEVEKAISIGGSVTVDGKVLKEVVAVGGSVYLGNSALVGGDVVSVGGRIEKSPGAIVKGDVTEVSFPGSMSGVFSKSSISKGFGVFSILTFLGFLVLVSILVAIFPDQIERAAAAIDKQKGKTFLVGLLAFLLIVPIIILLIVSIVGIVLIPVWGIVVAAAGLFGYIAAAQFIGEKVLLAFKLSKTTLLVDALVGVVILALVGLVPFVGWVVKMIVGCWGLGAVVMTRFGTVKA